MRTLRTLYQPKVSVRTYEYEGFELAQLHIHDDQLFYGHARPFRIPNAACTRNAPSAPRHAGAFDHADPNARNSSTDEC
jgi:hypothetical protein